MSLRGSLLIGGSMLAACFELPVHAQRGHPGGCHSLPALCMAAAPFCCLPPCCDIARAVCGIQALAFVSPMVLHGSMIQHGLLCEWLRTWMLQSPPMLVASISDD